jgi:hypothetical protein
MNLDRFDVNAPNRWWYIEVVVGRAEGGRVAGLVERA